jgi:hypothetical protein
MAGHLTRLRGLVSDQGRGIEHPLLIWRVNAAGHPRSEVLRSGEQLPAARWQLSIDRPSASQQTEVPIGTSESGLIAAEKQERRSGLA